MTRTAAARRKPAPLRPIVNATTTVGREDIDGLPHLFKLFAGEVRDSLERIEKGIVELRDAVKSIDRRVNELERKQHEHDARIATLESLRSA